MVIHNQVDWRTPDQSLEWDTALVRSVFWRIFRQYDEVARVKQNRGRKKGRDTELANDEPMDNQLDEIKMATQFDEHRLVAKADVLIGLKTTEQYLEQRPFLRSLATMLACCSNEKEMESVGNYVKYRLRERTTSFATVRLKLEAIYKKHVDLLAFEAKVEEFKAAAREKSTWCVRDPKSIWKKPSQFYGVHKVPPKPKTQKQIDMELQVVRSHAVAVTNNAITLVLMQLVNAARPKTRQKSARSGRRDSISRRSAGQSGTKSGSMSAADRAKQKRNREQAELRRRELRMQIFSPGCREPQRMASIESLQVPDSSDGGSDKRRNELQDQMKVLALVEANGELSIAQNLLRQPILRSGFKRVVEHLANLRRTSTSKDDNEPQDEWAVFKLWKTVYRNRTIQSIQQLE